MKNDQLYLELEDEVRFTRENTTQQEFRKWQLGQLMADFFVGAITINIVQRLEKELICQ